MIIPKEIIEEIGYYQWKNLITKVNRQYKSKFRYNDYNDRLILLFGLEASMIFSSVRLSDVIVNFKSFL